MSDMDNFGFEIENPITLTSIPVSYSYLEQLVLECGSEISYKRKCSINRIDVWDIYYKDTGTYLVTLYINCYADNDTNKCPKGFKFRKKIQKVLH